MKREPIGVKAKGNAGHVFPLFVMSTELITIKNLHTQAPEDNLIALRRNGQ